MYYIDSRQAYELLGFINLYPILALLFAYPLQVILKVGVPGVEKPGGGTF